MDVVGVVGAGVMGVGVAQNLAETGHRVVLLDLTDEQLGKARATIRQNLRMRGFFAKGKEPQEQSGAVMERITFTT
ncbi:MAG TPA: 3-hydroxyacyl-CoA dehydrogenase NAD-binding domain-containing protein, partial [Pyrinomonadaceae bacterium]